MKKNSVWIGEKEYGRKSDDYLRSITTIFTFAKWFGIPSFGGRISLCWAIILLAMLITIVVMAVNNVIRVLTGSATHVTDRRGVSARLSGAIFYGNALISLILSWRFISSWKHLSFAWARAETSTSIYFPPEASIRRRVLLVAGSVATCACVEHSLSMMAAIGLDCPLDDLLKRYILTSHGFLILPKDYSLYVGIPVLILSKSATILWNFQDLIIILISMGLTSRYRRFNLFVNQLVRSEKRNQSVTKQLQTWRRLRVAYVRQSALVRMVDNKIGALVLLSNINNFYFICLQLFLGISRRHAGKMINYVYYLSSLGWLLVRASSVVLAAANVHAHSKMALPSLHTCSEKVYNIEVRRLKSQLAYDAVALSGMGLFSLNRALFLQVVAAIIKYELVLIQFDK